jgi:C-terminal processing protease CtpA/Prc
MLYLVPGQHFGEVQEYDMSGLKLIKAPPAGATTVYSVDVGSPAFSAGLRAQDQVLSVSGQRAQLLGLKRIRQMLKAGDGDEVTIEASRQGETKEFKFHLKRFL